MSSVNDTSARNFVEQTSEVSKPARGSGSAFGSSQAPSSISVHPPINRITLAAVNDPLPLTVSGTTAENGTLQKSVSARRAEYDVADNGVVLSMPIMSQTLYSNNNTSTYEEDYDSDGQLGPFYDVVQNELDDDNDVFEEEEQIRSNEVNDELLQQNPQLEQENLPNYQLMTVARLKNKLQKRNLSVHGRKEVLLLCLYVPSHPAAIHHTTNFNVHQPQQPAITGFALEAKWVELRHHQERVAEPNQQHPSLVGPTVPEGQAKDPKYNFNEQFDRPLFTVLATVVKRNSKGRPVFDRQGRLMHEQVIREDGCANLDWLQKNKLTEKSQPSDWINALLPLKKKTGDSPSTVSIDEWTSYTNLWAILMNAGSSIYSGEFKPFTPQELRRFIALYILQGLSPSPQVKMKFAPQAMDKINGSHMCFGVFVHIWTECNKAAQRI